MTIETAKAQAKGEAKKAEQKAEKSKAVKLAGTQQKIKKQAATDKQKTAADYAAPAKEDMPVKRCTVSFSGARAVLVSAALFFAVAMALRSDNSSMSTSSNPRTVPPQWLPILLAAPAPAPAPAPPAPPCTVDMLKHRTAGDKSWPIACANVVLEPGPEDLDLDLKNASLSYGDFEGATFEGNAKIDLQGAGLSNSNLRGSKFEMTRKIGSNNRDISNRIIFTDADLENADLSLSTLYAESMETYSSRNDEALIDFERANLVNANLSHSKFLVETLNNPGKINFKDANLINADLSGLKLEAINNNDDKWGANTNVVSFENANLSNADLSDLDVDVSGYSYSLVDFRSADLSNADFGNANINAHSRHSAAGASVDFDGADFTDMDRTGWAVTATGKGPRSVSGVPPAPPAPSPSPASAPPCTVDMLKHRTAGDKSWPIACANVVLGGKNLDLDLKDASLSYGDFEGATFEGNAKIDLQGAGLSNSNLCVARSSR